jgi:hypothetical protein
VSVCACGPRHAIRLPRTAHEHAHPHAHATRVPVSGSGSEQRVASCVGDSRKGVRVHRLALLPNIGTVRCSMPSVPSPLTSAFSAEGGSPAEIAAQPAAATLLIQPDFGEVFL